MSGERPAHTRDKYAEIKEIKLVETSLQGFHTFPMLKGEHNGISTKPGVVKLESFSS